MEEYLFGFQKAYLNLNPSKEKIKPLRKTNAENINISNDHLEKIKDHIDFIRPDKVQLNTAVRPPAEKDAVPLDHEDLERLCSFFGKNTEVIAESKSFSTKSLNNLGTEEILAVLSRRPCRLTDLAKGLGMEHNQILKVLDQLQKEGKIRSEYQNNEQYYLKTGTEHSLLSVHLRE